METGDIELVVEEMDVSQEIQHPKQEEEIQRWRVLVRNCALVTIITSLLILCIILVCTLALLGYLGGERMKIKHSSNVPNGVMGPAHFGIVNGQDGQQEPRGKPGPTGPPGPPGPLALSLKSPQDDPASVKPGPDRGNLALHFT